MTRFAMTETEQRTHLATLAAEIILRQSGVLSVRATEEVVSPAYSVTNLLVTVDDELFLGFLDGSEHRGGTVDQDGDDNGHVWWDWTAYSRDDLAHLALELPCQDEYDWTIQDFFRDSLGRSDDLLKTLESYELAELFREIKIFLVPVFLDAFRERMERITLKYRQEEWEGVYVSPIYRDQNGSLVFHPDDFNELAQLQYGRLFNSLTRQFSD